ncbi:MAG: hypothetical protein ABSE84_28810 [Isosphaeraceae bacterium]
MVEERIYDRRVLKLLSAMLRAGVMEDGVVRSAVTGTPQGGLVSPLLCNVYLNRLDRQWNAKGVGKLVRYADLSRHRDKSAYAEFLIMPRIALDGSKTAENGCKSSA